MDSLDFSRLSLQFFKYQPNLKQNGFDFRLEEGSNLFEDQLVLSFSEFLKTYYFSTTAHLWDHYRQFTLWSSQTGKYHYRINPVTWEPFRINPDKTKANSYDFSFNVMTPAEMPADLTAFGQTTMQLIHQIANRINSDRLIHNSII